MAQKGLLTHRAHTRITAKKYEELTALLAKTQGINSLSELLRHILDNRVIKTKSHDATSDVFLEQLSVIKQDIRKIGININQVVRRIHGENDPSSSLLRAMELVKLYQQTEEKLTELFALIHKISGQWLRE